MRRGYRPTRVMKAWVPAFLLIQVQAERGLGHRCFAKPLSQDAVMIRPNDVEWFEGDGQSDMGDIQCVFKTKLQKHEVVHYHKTNLAT